MAAAQALCPQCGKPQVDEFRPFCSARCADVDLAHWLRGDYRIGGRDGDALDEEGRLPPAPAEDDDA